MIFYQTSHSHCPNGETQGNHACDTTVSTGSGNYSTQIKFPRFHPDSSSITCTINQVSTGCCTYHSGDYLFFVTGRESLNYSLKCCSCSSFVLPLNVRQFYVTKLSSGKAGIKRPGFGEYNMDYREVEMNNEGYDFSKIYSISENLSGHLYKFIYVAEGKKKWSQLIRIKQVYSDDFVRFSEIKSVELENSDKLKINIYPSPSNGVVGIKFVNLFSGKFLIQISNTQGQTVFSKKCTDLWR